MKTNLVRVAIVLLVLTELVWIVAPRQGSFLTQEQMEALRNYDLTNTLPYNPTAVQNLIHKPIRIGVLAMYAAVLFVFNGIVIFFFWNFGRRNKTASGSSATKTVSNQ
jgi:hypothetical protein